MYSCVAYRTSTVNISTIKVRRRDTHMLITRKRSDWCKSSASPTQEQRVTNASTTRHQRGNHNKKKRWNRCIVVPFSLYIPTTYCCIYFPVFFFFFSIFSNSFFLHCNLSSFIFHMKKPARITLIDFYNFLYVFYLASLFFCLLARSLATLLLHCLIFCSASS